MAHLAGHRQQRRRRARGRVGAAGLVVATGGPGGVVPATRRPHARHRRPVPGAHRWRGPGDVSTGGVGAPADLGRRAVGRGLRGRQPRGRRVAHPVRAVAGGADRPRRRHAHAAAGHRPAPGGRRCLDRTRGGPGRVLGRRRPGARGRRGDRRERGGGRPIHAVARRGGEPRGARGDRFRGGRHGQGR